MSDDLALLQLKVRHTNDLEERVEVLMRQNTQLARDNDELARELNERRYEIERIRAAATEHHSR
jgi:regulator of replication initiation timing